MNDLSNLFREFNDKISLTPSYKEKIRRARDAIRNKINNKFEKENLKKPKHHTQGSYTMHTAIMPLENEDFDLDNGIYLQDYGEDKEEWPSVQEVHKLIVEAIDGHTKDIIDKNTCVRVVYQDNYHIDLPIYLMGEDDENNEVAFLAHKIDGWIISDPKAFRNWFNDAVKNSEDQTLRRIVKYFKHWIHQNKIDLPGITITILASKHFLIKDDDAQTLLEVTTSILDELEENFTCFKPVRPTDEDLLSKIGFNQRVSILNSLRELKDKLSEALFDCENQKDSSIILRGLFGVKFFPLGNENKKNSEDYLETASPEKVIGKNRHYA
ncbi:CBASS cGAMP synthase [Listeria monocytogenes]